MAGNINPPKFRLQEVPRWIALITAVACALICLQSYRQSVAGFDIMLPARESDLTTDTLPFLAATLVLGFNALSPYLFRYFVEEGLSSFTHKTVFAFWVLALVFDVWSNMLGMFKSYAGVEVTSYTHWVEASSTLGSLRTLFTVMVAVLLFCAPLLTTLFFELAMSKKQQP